MFLLIDLVNDGRIVDAKPKPFELDYSLVEGLVHWQVAFRTEPELNAGGPVTVISDVDANQN